MENHMVELQSLIRPSYPILDNNSIIDPPSMELELMNDFMMENSSPSQVMSMHNLMMMMTTMPFSSSSSSSSSCDDHTYFASNHHFLPSNLEESSKGSLVHHHPNNNNNNNNAVQVCLPNFEAEHDEEIMNEGKKRKAIISPAASDSGRSKVKNIQGKRVKSNVTEQQEDKKPKEVVHVRARRGQATDSHSIAERVRRGKINEKLKCLQNIVPGCYKTMGMAVMLDEIINYVQSLQHQVEFLSLKLSAASNFYDFNSETDTLETMQRAKASEAKELAKYEREGYGGIYSFQPTWNL